MGTAEVAPFYLEFESQSRILLPVCIRMYPYVSVCIRMYLYCILVLFVYIRAYLVHICMYQLICMR